MGRKRLRRTAEIVGTILVGLVLLSFVAGSAAAQTAPRTGTDDGRGLIAVGAALAIGLAGIGTGIAQSNIGAAAVGATAENPKNFVKSLVFVAFPETIVIFGFVGFFLLLGKI